MRPWKCPAWPRVAAYFSLACIYFSPVHAETMDAIKQVIRKKFPAVRQCSTDELAAWLADTNRPAPLLIDARTAEEFAVSHLAGATNITSVDAFKQMHAPAARAAVVYCSVGYRSAALAEKLQRAGVTNVLNLEGSIFQWANEGRPVYRGTSAVHEVHPYSRKWGELLKADLHPRRD